MALMLGINVAANQSLFTLTDELQRHIDLDPKKFIDLHNDPKREFISVLKRGIAKGKITFDGSTGTYIYGNMPMGHNEEMAIQFLINNTGIATAITMKCNQEDAESKVSMQVNTPSITVNKEADLQRKVMELEAELAKTKKAEDFKQPFEGLISADEPKEETTNTVSEDTEMVSLRARAKELKVSSHALPKIKKETLAKLVEEAEAKQ